MDPVIYDSVTHLSDYELGKEISFAERSLEQHDSWLTLGWLTHLNNEKFRRVIRKVIDDYERDERHCNNG